MEHLILPIDCSHGIEELWRKLATKWYPLQNAITLLSERLAINISVTVFRLQQEGYLDACREPTLKLLKSSFCQNAAWPEFDDRGNMLYTNHLTLINHSGLEDLEKLLRY